MTVETHGKAALLARGEAARQAGNLAAAERDFLAAAACDLNDAEPQHYLGFLYEQAGDLARSERHYRRALELAPKAALTARALSQLLLSQGRYAEGFALAEARHTEAGYAKPLLDCPEWTGGDLAGKRIVVWPEQGLGDQIMFARFVPALQAMGADVVMLCWSALARLFAGSLDVPVHAARGEVNIADPELFVMICSLAGRLGATLETLPNRPYLKAPGAWEKPLPDGFKVGLMTAGNPAYVNDRGRSLPQSAADALRRLPAQVVDLRPSETGAADFADTAALLQQLDLVISVDTSVAHLAGAMGKPCWVLLPGWGADWRWLRGRRDSPWYPSLRLYRQPTPGDWDSVVREVEADLGRLLDRA